MAGPRRTERKKRASSESEEATRRVECRAERHATSRFADCADGYAIVHRSYDQFGNVWEEPFDADFSEYASSVGGGLRIDVPGFPIRFDYAVPLEKDDDLSRTQRWVFWVGFE